ncbi:MAG: methionine--tRNA ligase, partial [Clostridiales bacterium]|nr:methionine--tRNA ligase [Clostridiales bacterium]
MSEKKTFYITTPIYYPSDKAHIGHAYATVAADSMKRYKKMRDYDAFFLTGTDEHGLKIQRRAEEAGKTPQLFVDGIVEDFKNLWRILRIDYDDFLRTTDERHKITVQKFFQKLFDQGDIYKAEYQGWYCVPCETFFTASQAKDGEICPDCGRKLELTKEESYFFRMSGYAGAWMRFIEENPDFIQPASRKNEMLNFVKQGLEDLCVSRTSFKWGVPVPFDPKHVVYVWFEALINYISALGCCGDDDSLFRRYWPADVHLVGKDIIRFHAVIWPIMLMAAGLPLPKKVLGTGWIILGEGKMSKSKGNVVDPVVLVEKYGADAVRYFLLREMAYGQDSVYSEEALVSRINTDLANDYGNLLSRTTAMIGKFQGGEIRLGVVLDVADGELLHALSAAVKEAEEHYDKMDFAGALAAVNRLVNRANKYIDESAPWTLNKNGQKERLAVVLYTLAEVLRQATIMLSPVMPALPEKVWPQLGLEGKNELHTWESLRGGAIPAPAVIKRGEPVFPRIEFSAADEPAASPQDKKKQEAP